MAADIIWIMWLTYLVRHDSHISANAHAFNAIYSVTHAHISAITVAFNANDVTHALVCAAINALSAHTYETCTMMHLVFIFSLCVKHAKCIPICTPVHTCSICLPRLHFLCNAVCSRRMVYWLVVTQQWSVWLNLLDVDEARDFDSSFNNLLDTHVGICFFVGRSNPPKGSNHCIIIHFAVLDWRLCDWNDIEITWVLGVRLLETNCIPSDFW